MEEDLILYLKYAGYVTAIAGLCVSFWRYFVMPFYRFITVVRNNLEETAGMWPVLQAIHQRWPSPSGPLSLAGSVGLLENDLAARHARLTAVLDLIPVPVFECDSDGLCIRANKALCELFDLSLEHVLGNGWLEAVDPLDRLPVWRVWKDALAAGIPYEAHYRVQGRVDVVATAGPIRDGSRTIVSYFGTIIPVE